MRATALVCILVVVVACCLGMLGGGLGAFLWRRKLVRLLGERYPLVLQSAQSAPDVAPLGMPIASSTRLVRVVQNANVDDPEVLAVARSLQRLIRITLVSAVVVVLFMLAGKLNLW